MHPPQVGHCRALQEAIRWFPVVPKVTVKAPMRATEDPTKVAKAVQAFWPGCEVTVAEDHVAAISDEASSLRKRIWEQRIIDTFRAATLAGCRGQTVRFRLDKQAALVGKLALPAAKSGLGEIEVTVEVEPNDSWDDGEAFCWWLCPPTADGHIVDEAPSS